MNRYELVKDDDAAAGLKRIEAILSADSPYGLLKDADTLIGRVGEINKRLVQGRRDHASEMIDAYIDKVKDELDEVGATPALRNQCLHPIQLIRQQVDTESSIAHIYQLQSSARDAADEAFAEIEKAARQPAPVPPGDTGNVSVPDEKAKPQVSKPQAKKRRIIQPMRLAGSSYLETRDDVETFLDKLRKELEEAINNNERIEIR